MYSKLSDEKKSFNFLDLDKLDDDGIQLGTIQSKLFKEFDPENPPVLSYYDILKKRFKLPSKKLLEFERG
jgi:hypothetical protein